MAYIMKNTTCDTDSHRGEAQVFSIFEQSHYKKAENASGQTVEETKQASERTGIQDVPYHGNGKCMLNAVPVQYQYNHEVCQSEFDTGEGNGQRKQAFYITEYESYGCIDGQFCDFSGV